MKNTLFSTDKIVKETFNICPEGFWLYEKKKIVKKEKKANISWEE